MGKEQVLKQYFGYDNFRPGQGEVVDAIISGRDAVAVMPTGAGKSLCFQVPALLMEGISIVVSPLIALMRDQVGALVQSGVPAAYINSSQSQKESDEVIARAAKGEYKLLYVAPERLEVASFLWFATTADISMIAIDEAHCLSLWGQDFRPSYLNLGPFVEKLPRRPVVSAFTATATELVKDDIVRLLRLKQPLIRTSGFDRPNLRFEVRHPKDKDAELLGYLQARQGNSGIVYCVTRKEVERVTQMLKQAGIQAEGYHAGMGQYERSSVQDAFVYDKMHIIVATNAFGMGIDKSNVSFVVHYNMPKNMEGYYQEAGRAGRDGSPAECVLMFGAKDVMLNQYLIEKGSAYEDKEYSNELQAREFFRLRRMEAYCHTRACLRSFILGYFEDNAGEPVCGNCSNCSSSFKTKDITIDAQKVLSCIYHMRGRFGLTLLTDVLRGAKNSRITSLSLDKIKTYSQLAGNSAADVSGIVRFLIEQGYIRLHGARYALLDLTPKARELLIGKEKLHMPYALRKTAPADDSANSIKKPAQTNTELFGRLKDLRRRLAAEEGVPAYVIFSDAALQDMCAKHPTDENSLLQVSGVGSVKLRKYGKMFLEVLRAGRWP